MNTEYRTIEQGIKNVESEALEMLEFNSSNLVGLTYKMDPDLEEDTS